MQPKPQAPLVYKRSKRWTHGPGGRLLAKSCHFPSFTTKARNPTFSVCQLRFSPLIFKKIVKKKKKKRRREWSLLFYSTLSFYGFCAIHLDPQVKSSANTLLLRFMFVEQDMELSFHTGGSLDEVDKHRFKVSSLWHTFPHTFPGFWVWNESSLQTISLSNTLALTDRHRQTFQSHGNSQVWILLMRGERLCRTEIGRLIPKWSLQQFEKLSRRCRYRNYIAIKKWFIVGVHKVGENLNQL